MTTRRKYWLHFMIPKPPTVQARAQVEAQTALNFGLTRNHLRVAGHDDSSFDLLAIPTPTGRRAFELLDAPIPLTLK